VTDQTTVDVDAAKINDAYQGFLRTKYPAEEPRTGEFKFFDPTDAIPDTGLAFLYPPTEYMTTPRNKMGINLMLKVLRTTHRQPQRAGWYLGVAQGWAFIAPTVQEAVELFAELSQEV